MERDKKSKPSLRAKADKIRDFRCKNLIAVIERPDDLRNIGTIIRNVNALGVDRAYVVTDQKALPDDWQEMRGGSKLPFSTSPPIACSMTASPSSPGSSSPGSARMAHRGRTVSYGCTTSTT